MRWTWAIGALTLCGCAASCRGDGSRTPPAGGSSDTTAGPATSSTAGLSTDGAGADTTTGTGATTGGFDPAAIDVQAHRGDRANHPPGNTLVAFTAALELGVDTLEGDMQITADGAVVLGHDDDLAVTGCELSDPGVMPIPSRKLSEMTLAEVARWDCHPEVDGVQSPPELADVLALDDDVAFNLELKRLTEADADVYLSALIAYDSGCGGCLSGRLTVQCFAWSTLAYARATYHAHNAGSALAFDVSLLAVVPSLADLATAAVYADVVSPSFAEVTPELVTTAHDLALRVVPWTVNDPEAMQALLDLGVDGLITDDPATLLALLGR